MASQWHQQTENETYTFQSKPRPVERHAKCFYNDSEPVAPYGNIMYDRRVIRGNTYALSIFPYTAQPDPVEILKRQEIRRQAVAKKRFKDRFRPHSPEPLQGRKHVPVQTELFLEELSDRIEEADVDTQTETFLDRPPTPLFIPAKSGQDISTQIADGELFDFDLEVQPILQILVGKTTEQALLEVVEEEELKNLRQQQREFEELRNAELAEMQRLEEQEKRYRDEKIRRMKQQREVLRNEKDTVDKIAARAFAISYVSDLIPAVFDNLREHGYFYDPIERDVEQGFLPIMMEAATTKVDWKLLGRTILDGIINDVVNAKSDAYQALNSTKKVPNASNQLGLQASKQTVDPYSRLEISEKQFESTSQKSFTNFERPTSSADLLLDQE